jgi:hypothetical protein
MSLQSNYSNDKYDMLQAALSYAAKNWKIFPVHYITKNRMCSCGKPNCEHPGKHPMTAHGFLDATLDEEQIRKWWTKIPDANIGVATGKASNLIVWDIDPRNCGDDSNWLIEKEHGPFPTTAEVLTGGGGQHLYFKNPPEIHLSCCKPRAGIDFKANGGYVLLPPSNHISGKRYFWDCSYHIDDTQVAEIPIWLIEELKSKEKLAALPPEHWRKLISNKIETGSRDQSITSLTGHLLAKGVDPYVTLNLMIAVNNHICLPPLRDADIFKIVNSISGRELARRGKNHV